MYYPNDPQEPDPMEDLRNEYGPDTQERVNDAHTEINKNIDKYLFEPVLDIINSWLRDDEERYTIEDIFNINNRKLVSFYKDNKIKTKEYHWLFGYNLMADDRYHLWCEDELMPFDLFLDIKEFAKNNFDIYFLLPEDIRDNYSRYLDDAYYLDPTKDIRTTEIAEELCKELLNYFITFHKQLEDIIMEYKYY